MFERVRMTIYGENGYEVLQIARERSFGILSSFEAFLDCDRFGILFLILFCAIISGSLIG